MIKLLGPLAKTLFAVFVLAVFAGIMYYSWNALALIFPGDLKGQLFGMALFDLAALVWFLVFVKECKSTMQYVFSILGFLIGLSGTLFLVSVEVQLSSGARVIDGTAETLSTIFTSVMIGHLILTYAFHAVAPEVSAGISLGVERARITDRAQQDAERMLVDQTAALSMPIAREHVRGVIRDLNLQIDDDLVIDLQPMQTDQSDEKKGGSILKNFFSLFPGLRGNGAKKYESSVVNAVKSSSRQTPKRSPAAEDVGLADGDVVMRVQTLAPLTIGDQFQFVAKENLEKGDPALLYVKDQDVYGVAEITGLKDGEYQAKRIL